MNSRIRLAAAGAAGLLAVLLLFLRVAMKKSSIEISGEEPPPRAQAGPAPLVAVPLPAPERAQPAGVSQSPTPLPPAYSNEDLHRFLEEDKKRMGIKKIYLKGELKEQQRPPVMDEDRAKRIEEAKEKIRYMAEELRKGNEARKRQPIAINGDKPALLSKPEDSYLAHGGPTAPDPAPAAPEEPSANPPSPYPNGGVVIKSQGELDRLWEEMRSSRPKPRIDFSRKMIVAVIADPDSGKGVLIPNVRRSASQVVVEYRDALPDESGTYYEIQIVDKSDAPIVFKKTRVLAPRP